MIFRAPQVSFPPASPAIFALALAIRFGEYSRRKRARCDLADGDVCDRRMAAICDCDFYAPLVLGGAALLAGQRKRTVGFLYGAGAETQILVTGALVDTKTAIWVCTAEKIVLRETRIFSKVWGGLSASFL